MYRGIGYAQQELFDSRDLIAGIFSARIIDRPNEDLFLFADRFGRFDLRRCYWKSSFFNKEEGFLKLPRPWIYSETNILQEQGDTILIAFLSNSTENPVILGSVIPTDADSFFELFWKETTTERFPVKENYYNNKLFLKLKSSDRTLEIKEDNGTISIMLGETTLLTIQEGEIVIGGATGEKLILGESFLTFFNTFLTTLKSHTHAVVGGGGGTATTSTELTTISDMTETLLTTQGKGA